jgi:hypothetical protein
MLPLNRMLRFLAGAVSIVLWILTAFLLVQLALDVMRVLQSVPTLIAGAAIMPLIIAVTVFAFATPVVYRKWDHEVKLYPYFALISGIQLLLIGGAGIARFRFYMVHLQMSRQQILSLINWPSPALFGGLAAAGAAIFAAALIYKLRRRRPSVKKPSKAKAGTKARGASPPEHG